MLFTVDRIQKLLAFFWSIVDPQVQVLHRPTFRTSNVDEDLISSMLLLACCRSPNVEDQTLGMTLLPIMRGTLFAVRRALLYH